MRVTVHASELLAKAKRHLTTEETLLVSTLSGIYTFTDGANWMRQALGEIRSTSLETHDRLYELLGIAKYLLCLFAAAILLLLIQPVWLALPLAVCAFYLVEAQFVFLFPVLIDGLPNPLSVSSRLTVKAGGRVRVMCTVLPIAAYMLSGPFRCQSMRFAWGVGCLAVVYWYETVLRVHDE
jgi:hypothetical protein